MFTLHDITLRSVFLRMLLAVICGGCIGIEREFKRRPAGFRTHILICLGATITTLTSQYLHLYMGFYTDMTRIGAQVIAGIGFIGGGTILVTKRQQVKGVTTAAGLWTAAIVGLTIGAGFYEAAVLGTVLILLAELLFAQIEYRMLKKAPDINLYMEYTNKTCLENVLQEMRKSNIEILDMEITRAKGNKKYNASAIFLVRLSKNYDMEALIFDIYKIDGVFMLEKL